MRRWPEDAVVSAGLTAMLIDAGVRLGIGRDRMVAATGLTAADLADADRLVPGLSSARVWDPILAQFPGEPVGLKVAGVVDRQSLGLPMLVISLAPTLRGCLERLVRFHCLISPAQQWRFDRLDGAEALCFDSLIPPDVTHIRDFGPASTFRWVVERAGGRAVCREVRLTHDAVGSVEAYTAFYGIPVAFGQSRSALLFADGALDMPNPTGDQVLGSYLERLAEQHLRQVSELHPPASALPEVRRAVESGILAGSVSLASVAQQLSMSARSLQRHIERAGTTYNDVVQEVRLSLAERMICEPDTPLTHVAFALGYAELSSFYRAFKRWTGETPDQYRRKCAGHVRA